MYDWTHWRVTKIFYAQLLTNMHAYLKYAHEYIASFLTPYYLILYHNIVMTSAD